MENNLITNNDSYKLIAAGALMTLLALNNINSTYVFKLTDTYKEALNMNYLSKSELKSDMYDSLLIKDHNSSFFTKNNILDLTENEQELSVDNNFKRRRVKIMVKNRRRYVPFFDFEEVDEEL